MATPNSREDAIRLLNEQTNELKQVLSKTRLALNALSAKTLAHLQLGPIQFELQLLHSFVNDVVKYQNRLEAELRRK